MAKGFGDPVCCSDETAGDRHVVGEEDTGQRYGIVALGLRVGKDPSPLVCEALGEGSDTLRSHHVSWRRKGASPRLWRIPQGQAAQP